MGNLQKQRGTAGVQRMVSARRWWSVAEARFKVWGGCKGGAYMQRGAVTNDAASGDCSPLHLDPQWRHLGKSQPRAREKCSAERAERRGVPTRAQPGDGI